MNVEMYNKSIYLMPFAATTAVLLNFLKSNNVNVLGFLDNDAELQTKEFHGYKIFSPSEAFFNNPDAVVILGTIRFFDVMEEQLNEIGFKKPVKCTKLPFNFDLIQNIDILNDDYLYQLAPRQIPFARHLMKVASSLKTWNSLCIMLTGYEVVPYRFNEAVCSIEYKPNPSVSFIVCVNATRIMSDCFYECLNSISLQTHKNYFLVIVNTENTVNYIRNTLDEYGFNDAVLLLSSNEMNNIDVLEFTRDNFADKNKYDYMIVVGAEDKLFKSALSAFACEAGAGADYKVYTSNEDRIYGDDHISPYYKKEYQKYNLVNISKLLRNSICISTKLSDKIIEISNNDVYIIEEILYHYRIINNVEYDNNIKPIAFYLPQFHAIEENDEWWGKGFTEWTNVKRAFPMFEGHSQPRVPGQLGYYDLIEHEGIQKKQMEMAKKYGIYGFCYYYYWFNGRRLLEKPLDNVLNNPELDLPFCICWANENWTRRWDGLENEVLMPQRHDEKSDKEFFLDVLPILKDPRYIKINGAPILLIYRYNLFPNFKATVEAWRKLARKNGIERIHISVVKTTELLNAEFKDLGCDSETEMPPFDMNSPLINEKVKNLKENFSGWIYDYSENIYRSMNVRQKEHLWFRGAAIGFDNTARKLERAWIYHGSTPDLYKKLFISLVDSASRRTEEERLIFINAWNEWAEGTYLEPDSKHGDGYLKATNEAIKINC